MQGFFLIRPVHERLLTPSKRYGAMPRCGTRWSLQENGGRNRSRLLTSLRLTKLYSPRRVTPILMLIF